jgi:predicted SAM-dependent methyltransferase
MNNKKKGLKYALEPIYKLGWLFLKQFPQYNAGNKLNIGASRWIRKGWIRKGWINLDYYNKHYCNTYQKHADIKHNLNTFDPIPVKDNSLDKVYSSHCFEHIIPKYLFHNFAEIYRMLKPGGIVRILVPDKDKVKGTRFDYTKPESKDFGDHKTLFDFKFMEMYLISVGFKDIRKSTAYGSTDEEFRSKYKLYSMGFDGVHSDISLFVEARK